MPTPDLSSYIDEINIETAKAKAPPHNATLSYKRVMEELKVMREEQARGWLVAASNPDMPQVDFGPRLRELMRRSATIGEVQIMEVVEEIERNPPLVKRQRTKLLAIWRATRKELRKLVSGQATDDEIAEAYKAQFEQKRMHSRDRWYKWNGSGVWTPQADVTDEIWTMMCEFKHLDIKPSSHKRASIEECLRGSSLLGVPELNLDAYPEWVNLLNGVYDFDSGALIPHSPTQYLTTQLPFEFDASATCPRWHSFLSEVLVDHAGRPDPAMARFMCQAFGYSLTAWTKYEMSFWLQGGGANGKSTLVHILSALTGTASRALNLGMLERDTYQLALLPGIRVVTCTESPVGLKVADSIIKTLISGDVTTARLPYGKPFQLEPQCKIWWAMNNYPRVADTSEGFWRKVKVVPFLASFYGNARDQDLRQKLEEELPGIFNWALGGLRSLVANGWTACEAIDGATETYRRANDVEAVFIEECCILGNEYIVGARNLYDAYRSWCIETGHRPKTSTRVAADWLRLGFEKTRKNSGVVYIGVGLSV